MPATLALAVTVAVPPADLLGVVSVTDATPLALVRAELDPPAKAPNSGSVLKATIALGTAAPLLSVRVAVKVAGLVAEMEVIAAPVAGSVRLKVRAGLAAGLLE